MPSQFQIIFLGRILPGHTPEQVRDNVAKRLALSAANQEALFSGRRAVLKRGLDFATADTLREEYARLGMKVHIEPEQVAAPVAPPPQEDDLDILPPVDDAELADEQDAAAPAAAPLFTATAPTRASTPAVAVDTGLDEMTCPSCNTRQPKRTLCRSCGIDMPRFLAGQQQAERDARAARAAEASERRLLPVVRRTERRPERVRAPAPRKEQAPLFGVDFKGRFSRSGYLISSLLSVCVFSLAVVATVHVGFGAFVVGLIVMLVQGVRASILRLHDTGQSGYLAFVLLVPGLGSLFALALVFWPGDVVANRYGEAPEPAPLPLQLVLFILTVVIVAFAFTQAENSSYLSTGSTSTWSTVSDR
jgi:uncharacterized membrane protein YhaH (DUF805 family)